MTPNRVPEIGVLVWTGQEYGRRVLVGAQRHARAGRGIGLHMIAADAHGGDELAAECAEINRLDGVIAALDPYCNRLRLPHIRVPVVESPLFGSKHPGALTVATDAARIGALAADHLLSLRVRHVVFWDIRPGVAAEGPADALRQCVEAARSTTFETVARFGADSDSLPIDWWRSRLPVGVLCHSDGSAQSLAEKVHGLGLHVPNDVAILGIGDDPITCNWFRAGLSSIALPSERVGELAAEALLRLVEGEPVQSVLLPPVAVRPRGSTAVHHSGDPLVTAAVGFIRTHYAQPIGTVEVAAQVGVSRRTLETRFRAAVGRTPHEELVRCRLDVATTMLANTEEPLKCIASAIGEPCIPHFIRFVKHHTGLSALAYRKRHGVGASGE